MTSRKTDQIKDAFSCVIHSLLKYTATSILMAKVDALKVPNLLHYLRALNMRHCRKILQCESQFANWPGRASRLCVQPVLTYRLGIHG